MEGLHTERRGHGTDGGVQALADRLSVEPDGNDVGDALRGRHLSDDQVRTAPRHQSVNLIDDERRHVGFPAEPVTFALIGGRLARGGWAPQSRWLQQRPDDFACHREEHLSPVLRRDTAWFLSRRLVVSPSAPLKVMVRVREAIHSHASSRHG